MKKLLVLNLVLFAVAANAELPAPFAERAQQANEHAANVLSVVDGTKQFARSSDEVKDAKGDALASLQALQNVCGVARAGGGPVARR